MTEGGAINTTGDQTVSAARDTQAIPRPADSIVSDGATDRAFPPMIPVCGEFPIRIARDGTWFYHGTPIGRKTLVKLFARVLARQPDGAFWLVTPYERGVIVVDDAPFVAVLCQATGIGEAQRLTFTTNLDEEVVAGTDHPVIMRGSVEAPAPYVVVRPGLEARISRAVFYQLADLLCEHPRDGRVVSGIWSDGVFFALEPLGV
jgi:uncharacterized protein